MEGHGSHVFPFSGFFGIFRFNRKGGPQDMIDAVAPSRRLAVREWGVCTRAGSSTLDPRGRSFRADMEFNGGVARPKISTEQRLAIAG